MASSSFAQKQLEKHGWKKGSGLGKTEDGMSDPIKVSLKMDKAGVGHDPGKEFTDHWWLRVFNDAAKKIGSKKQEKDASKKEADKKMDRKQAFYAGFVKSSTLNNGVEEQVERSDSSSDEEDSDNQQSVPTLNDIHKFCGGATGHKAARFGIKMGGKLARVAQHDQMVEERLQKSSGKKLEPAPGAATSDSTDGSESDTKLGIEISATRNGDGVEEKPRETEEIERKSKKEKKKKRKKERGDSVETAGDTVEETDPCSVGESDSVKSKKKKDKSKSICDDSIELEENEDSKESDSVARRKSKKDKSDTILEVESSEGDSVKRKKKKKKSKTRSEGDTLACIDSVQNEESASLSVPSEAEDVPVKQKKKKKDKDLDIEVSNEEVSVRKEKKKKRKHKAEEAVEESSGKKKKDL